MPSEPLNGRLESLFDQRRGKLCKTAMRIAGFCGAVFPGLGTMPFEAVLEASGVQERQLRNQLAALDPTFRTERRGSQLFVWCRELAVDQAWRWDDPDLLAGVYHLEREAHPYAAQARAFYEDVRASRRNVRRKNTENRVRHSATDSRQCSELEKPGFHERKSPSVKTQIPEEEIPRPAGGSRSQRWDLDKKINEKSGISSLSGGGPERPERPRALEGVRRETEQAPERPTLAKAQARPPAATETRPPARPATPAPREEETLAEGLPGFRSLCRTPMPTQYVTEEQTARRAWNKAMADAVLQKMAAMAHERGVEGARAEVLEKGGAI